MVAASAETWKPQRVVWAAQGDYARERGAQPVEQPGYRVPLSGFTRLARPVTLARLRGAKDAMARLVAAETAAGNRPLYFPFELGSRDLRPMQGYAFKLPASFLELFPELVGAKVVAPVAPGTAQRNPPWSRDEPILALDLYRTNPASPPSPESPTIAELSAVLSRMARLLGVSTPTVPQRQRRLHEDDRTSATRPRLHRRRQEGPETAITKMRRWWGRVFGDHERLAAVAAAIRAAVASKEATELLTVDDEGTEEAAEGRSLDPPTSQPRAEPQARGDQKGQGHARRWTPNMRGVELDFAETYGKRGEGFMEVHHTRPVHEIMPGQVTRLADLALVYANCHRMIHARRPWLTIEELGALLRARNRAPARGVRLEAASLLGASLKRGFSAASCPLRAVAGRRLPLFTGRGGRERMTPILSTVIKSDQGSTTPRAFGVTSTTSLAARRRSCRTDMCSLT